MTLQPIQTVLARHPEIQLAYVFGSVASNTAMPDSDLDIAVQTDRTLDAQNRMQWINELAVATGRPVDLIDLRSVGEPLLGQILKYGTRLVGSNADHAELTLRHIYAMEDFVPYVERMLRERRQAWIG